MTARIALGWIAVVGGAFACSMAGSTATGEMSADESFQPIKEANMPEGFPAPAGVGEIVVKQYPAYRKAETAHGPRGGFWTLFQHIKRNDVAMTAPVEMAYRTDVEQPTPTTMAFLYGSQDLGSAGQQGRVSVADVPAMTTVSVGVRGPRTTEAVQQALAQLEQWMQENAERFEASGSPRVMAYNSPFVPRRNNFFEVEIPLRERTTTNN